MDMQCRAATKQKTKHKKEEENAAAIKNVPTQYILVCNLVVCPNPSQFHLFLIFHRLTSTRVEVSKSFIIIIIVSSRVLWLVLCLTTNSRINRVCACCNAACVTCLSLPIVNTSVLSQLPKKAPKKKQTLNAFAKCYGQSQLPVAQVMHRENWLAICYGLCRIFMMVIDIQPV